MTDCQIENHPGHGQPCHYCKEPCDGFAGNPGRWPVALCYPDDPGKVKWHHTACVVNHIEKLAARVAKLEARLEIDHYYVCDPEAKTGLDPETGKFNLGLKRVEATEEEREDFPDKILGLECEVAHLKEDRDACARERDEAVDRCIKAIEAEFSKKRDEYPAQQYTAGQMYEAYFTAGHRAIAAVNKLRPKRLKETPHE